MGEPQQASGIAYVANRNSNSVSVINTATQQVIAEIRVGTTPVALALTPDGIKVYVVNFGSSDV
jgi:YVTN family beta-propeller protein